MRFVFGALVALCLSTSVLAQSAAEPDEILSYGSGPSQRVEVFLPAHRSPVPVVVFIPGGCYISQQGGSGEVRPVMAELRKAGVAAWSVGYRRTDEPGGTFPGTFEDVSTAIDMIRREAPRMNLDLSRVVFAGHSAGGHLALWAAARPNIDAGSPLHDPDPVRLIAVVAVAAPTDIEPLRPLFAEFCGPGVFERLMGEPATTRPDIYADTSPARLLPLRIPVRLIVGSDDEVVPPPFMREFEAQAKAAGDDAFLEVVPDADHIDVIAAGEDGWAAVQRTVLKLLDHDSQAEPRRTPAIPDEVEDGDQDG